VRCVSCRVRVSCVWLHRLNLMANALRNEGVWHAFSAGTPSLANLQFTCQTLVLSLNELTQVPVEVCRLVNLPHLYVSFNRLTSLPTEIGCLKHLTVRRRILFGRSGRPIITQIVWWRYAWSVGAGGPGQRHRRGALVPVRAHLAAQAGSVAEPALAPSLLPGQSRPAQLPQPGLQPAHHLTL
jgi:Leucine-rich repeat (LRR) protein